MLKGNLIIWSKYWWNIEKYGCLEREEVWYFKWRKSNLQVGGVKTWLI